MKKQSLSRRIAVAFLLLIVLPFLVITGSQAIRFSGTLRNNMYAGMQQTLRQCDIQLSAKLSQAESFINQLRMDENLRQAITDINEGTASGDSYLALQQFNRSLTNYLSVFDVQVYSVCISTCEKIICQSINSRSSMLSQPVAEQTWFQNALSAQGKLCWNGLTEEKKGNRVFSVSCAMRSASSQNLNIVGALNVAFYADPFFPDASTLDEEALLAYYHAETGAFCWMNGNSSALKDEMQSLLDSGKAQAEVRIQGRRYYFTLGKPDSYGWVILYALPMEHISSVVLSTMLIFAGVTLAGLLMILFFLMHMQTRLLRPLEEAIAFINENTLHQVELKSDAHGYPEIRTMRQRAALYVRDKMDAEKNLRAVSAERDMAQMKRLQMQISPHFLYNILNSVKILADTGRNQDVSQVTYHLIHLLNACMDRSGMFVTVRQEMETLRHYFAIQKVVYEDTVLFQEDMQPELDTCEIPNFIFQPIVENSLQHGLDLSRDDNCVKIWDHAENDMLLVEIEDNGIGIAPEQLERIRHDMQCEVPVAHIGICSVHNRIRFSCGSAYGIEIESKPGQGAHFTLRLPLTGKRKDG